MPSVATTDATLPRDDLPLARGGVLRDARIAVHPGDTTVQSLLDSIDATYGRFVRSHRPARYTELLA